MKDTDLEAWLDGEMDESETEAFETGLLENDDDRDLAAGHLALDRALHTMLADREHDERLVASVRHHLQASSTARLRRKVISDLDPTPASPPAPRPSPASEGTAPMLTLRIIAGHSSGQNIRLDKTRLLIGRGEHADLVLRDPGLSREHAEIVLDGDRVRIVDLGSTNGTKLNGTTLDGPDTLSVGDRITIGKAELVACDGNLLGCIRLLATTGPLAGREFPLGDDRLVFGRRSTCDIVLRDKAASGEHAAIRLDGLQVLLEDLGSSNGTWIAGKQIEEPMRLRSGTTIAIGTSRLLFIDGRIDDLRGTTIPGHTLIRRIASGSIGVVYQAKDHTTGELVAVKILDPAIGGDPVRKARLLNTIRALSRTRHENILPTLGDGTHAGLLYFTMPWITNGSLRDLAEQPVPPAIVASLALDAATGLAAADEMDLHHHGLHMGDLLVSEEGVGMVADFGLSEAELRPAGDSPLAVSQFELGRTLHQALLGNDATIGALDDLRDDDIPAALIDNLHRMTAVDPADRYQSWDDLVSALDTTVTRIPPPEELSADDDGTGALAPPLPVAPGAAAPAGEPAPAVTLTGPNTGSPKAVTASGRLRPRPKPVSRPPKEADTVQRPPEQMPKAIRNMLIVIGMLAFLLITVPVILRQARSDPAITAAAPETETDPGFSQDPETFSGREEWDVRRGPIRTPPTTTRRDQPLLTRADEPARDDATAPTVGTPDRDDDPPPTRAGSDEEQDAVVATIAEPAQAEEPPTTADRTATANDVTTADAVGDEVAAPVEDDLADSPTTAPLADEDATPPATAPPATETVPEPDEVIAQPAMMPDAELDRLLAAARPDTWEEATITLADGKSWECTFKPRADTLVLRLEGGDELPVERDEVAQLAYLPSYDIYEKNGDRAMKYKRFDEAVEKYQKALEDKPDHPYIVTRLAEAKDKKERLATALSGMVTTIENQDWPGILAYAADYIDIDEPKRLDNDWENAIEAAYERRAIHMDHDERATWQARAEQANLKLEYDAQAPVYLDEAMAAFNAGEDDDTIYDKFQKAREAFAPMNDDAWWALARVCARVGENSEAAHALVQLSPRLARTSEVRALGVKVGWLPPPLEPSLLCLTYVGAKGNQRATEVGFTANGIAFAKGNGWQFTYDPNTGKPAVGGDVHNDYGEDMDRYKLDLKPRSVTVPATGETLTIRYKQVSGILQQPFLTSDSGWKFWGWSRGEAEPHGLMSDSRGYDIWLYPDGRHVGVLCWCDGGNSVLARHPQDLSKSIEKSDIFSGGYSNVIGGMSTMVMKIDVVERKPVSGSYLASHVFPHVRDAWGRTYIGKQIGRRWAGSTLKDPFNLGEVTKGGLFVFDTDLKTNILHAKVGGAGGSREDLGLVAIRDNILIMAGFTDAPDMQVINGTQDKLGGGFDGCVAVIRLWNKAP